MINPICLLQHIIAAASIATVLIHPQELTPPGMEAEEDGHN